MENCLERSSKLGIAALALSILAFATGCHCQSCYVVGVGSAIQWTVPPQNTYYQYWADECDFHVNDTLYFEYDSSLHNVFVVQTANELYSCNGTNSVHNSTRTGVTEITLSTNNTRYYFMSLYGDGNDCYYNGMSFYISVGSCAFNDGQGDFSPSGAPDYPDYSPSGAPGNESTPTCAPNRGQVVMNENVSRLSLTSIPWGPHADSSWISSVLPPDVPLNSTIVFNYSRTDNHSVYRVEADGYVLCDISEGKEIEFGASYQLSEPGVYYFIDGNQSLCQYSNMRLEVVVNNPNDSGSHNLNVPLIVSVVASTSLVFAIFCILLYLYRKRLTKRYKRHSFMDESYHTKDEKVKASQDKKLRDGMLREKDGIKTCKLFTLKELEVATSHFSKENELGSGGFGTVYKAVLKDGQVVAVKRAISQRATDIEQFINEVSILSQVNHCNLVKLLGCCLDLKVPLLVYEFISNGTLEQHLSQSQQGQSTQFDWQRRFNIAIQTAEALKYLHSQANPPIVHRDVKAANILLDDNFGAKVADFGLSKLVEVGATHVSTAIRGTPGYLDPEYYFNSQLTDKSDVYSYGMVLLELITSKKPIDLTLGSTEQKNLALRLVPVIVNKGAREIIDPQLVNRLSEEDLATVEAVAEVAVACLVKEGASRPSMAEVVEMLQRIRGSKLQAGSFFKREEITSEKSWKPQSDWILSSFDTMGQSFDLEAGGQIMPESTSSVPQSPSNGLLSTSSKC
ncbi:unnamed protein product [Calypogeia fissa]